MYICIYYVDMDVDIDIQGVLKPDHAPPGTQIRTKYGLL